MLTLWGLSPQAACCQLINMVEVVVGTSSGLSGTPTQFACAAIHGVTIETASLPGAATVPDAETYHQYDVATARVGARCHSSSAVPVKG